MSDRRVFVVGSLNADHRVRVARIPSGGETVIGGEVTVSPGGKGANQAVAAARAGAGVTIVGTVGDDRDGELLRDALAADGIDIRYLRRVHNVSTGRALVTVDEDGENSIVVSPGANSFLGTADVDAGLGAMRAGDLLLLQLETPLALVRYAARKAAATGGTVVVNAAPVPASVEALFDDVDLVVVNEHELAGVLDLLRHSNIDLSKGRDADMAMLASRTGAMVVCTAGGDGAFVTHNGGIEHVAARRIDAVDTTAAGDTFIGYLAAGMASSPSDVTAALGLAVRASAAAVTRPGAVDSIPRINEIDTAAARVDPEAAE